MVKLLAFLTTGLLFGNGCATAPASDATSARAQPVGRVARFDPALDALVPPGARIEKIGGGFGFIEGPLWRPDGSLWFSDVTGNVVRRWSLRDGAVTEILRPGGFDKNDAPAGSYIGPNGMAADKDGAVLLCQHGNRRIVRIDKDHAITIVADRYQDKRLNSPNDLVYRSDGSLYFTDPPYGLLKQDDDPAKELPHNGIYRLAAGTLELLAGDLSRPNGIAFSPDEKTLYVANSDPARKIWMRYDVTAAGKLENGRIFFDVTAETEDGLPDGMKVDARGNVYATGPGGVWIFTPDGKHLGTIKPPEAPANCGFGDGGNWLYMTARTGLYRIRLAVGGKPALYQ